MDQALLCGTQQWHQGRQKPTWTWGRASLCGDWALKQTRGSVEPPSLGIFQFYLDRIVCHGSGMTLLQKGAGTRWSTVVPSTLTHSEILWNYLFLLFFERLVLLGTLDCHHTTLVIATKFFILSIVEAYGFLKSVKPLFCDVFLTLPRLMLCWELCCSSLYPVSCLEQGPSVHSTPRLWFMTRASDFCGHTNPDCNHMLQLVYWECSSKFHEVCWWFISLTFILILQNLSSFK